MHGNQGVWSLDVFHSTLFDIGAAMIKKAGLEEIESFVELEHSREMVAEQQGKKMVLFSINSIFS